MNVIKSIEDFPNGVVGFLETHFEISSQIAKSLELENSEKVTEVHEGSGHGGLYELAQDLTMEFETKYKDYDWSEGINYFDAIEEFLNEKLK